ncbi:glycoside hydrolase family 28 protein, partial [Agrobacterium sp. S2]|nr:glycoside hydrolase family 28 protein [Agrobacterium sp. S2]
AEGRIVGMEDYPGGMPTIYLEGVHGFSADDVAIKRAMPLPEGWNSQEIVATASSVEGSR